VSDLLWLGLLTISVIVNVILLEQVQMLNREIDMFLEDCRFWVEEW
jgi:hypothetical protein